ncbi:MAG: hypothetical protein DRI80_08250 [Chloroflexota bacterium]|nr:MAG: hypothetical protein DRI80_08250 [Chloroflexota bacterium]
MGVGVGVSVSVGVGVWVWVGVAVEVARNGGGVRSKGRLQARAARSKMGKVPIMMSERIALLSSVGKICQ